MTGKGRSILKLKFKDMKQFIYIIAAIWIFTVCSCSQTEPGDIIPDESHILLTAYVEEKGTTKGDVPVVDENGISDLNIFLFNENGQLAYSRYFHEISEGMSVPFARKNSYSLYAIANAGDLSGNPGTLNTTAISRLVWHLEDISGLQDTEGCIPMAGKIDQRGFEDGENVTVPLRRMYAKFRLIADKSMLDESVETFEIYKVVLRNLNRNISYFTRSKSGSAGDILPAGTAAEGAELQKLHSTGIDFYIPENAHGNLLPGNIDEKTHIPPEPYNNLCTYVELHVKYRNEEHYNENLIYRYYLHDGSPDNFDILRNTMYTCKTIFRGSGINEDTWRIDVSGMKDLVTSVHVSPAKRTLTEIGETFRYTATVVPASAENPEVSWSTDNPSVATVGEDGTVTAKGKGSCKVIATATDGTGKSGYAIVEVDTYKFPQSITVSPESAEIFIGESVALTTTVLPEAADDRDVIWKSSNESIATVDADGKVTGISEGSALIIGCTKANNLMDTAKVYVKRKLFSLGDIPIVLYPDYNSPHEITWKSQPDCTPELTLTVVDGDPYGARIEGKKIVAHNNGTKEGNIGSYRLVAKGNGTEITRDFKVEAGSIRINGIGRMIYLGETKTLTLSSLTPADAKVFWSSSDNSIATVDAKGTVTPAKLGSCRIRATTVSGAYDEIEIEVSYPYIALKPFCQIFEGTGFDLKDSTDFGSTTGLEVSYRILSGDKYIDLNGSVVKGLLRSGTERALIEAYYIGIPESYARCEIMVNPAVSAELVTSHRIVNTAGRISDGSDWSSFMNHAVIRFSHAPNTDINWTFKDSEGNTATGFHIMDDGRLNIVSNTVMGSYTITGWDNRRQYKTDEISIEVYKLLEYEIVLTSFTTYQKMNFFFYIFTLSSRWHHTSFSAMNGFEQNMLLQQKLVTYFRNQSPFHNIGSPGKPSPYLIDFYSDIRQTPLGGFNDIRNNLPYDKSYLRDSFTANGNTPSGLAGQYYKLTTEINGIDGYYFIKQRNNSLTQ